MTGHTFDLLPAEGLREEIMEQRVDILSKLLFRLIRDERPGDVKAYFSEMLGEINPQ